MKIQCPECKRVYQVDASKIPDAGANVKCKCETKFFIKKDTLEAEEKPIILEESTTEEVQKKDSWICPKCGHNRKTEDLECPSCGIVYEKYKEKPIIQEEPKTEEGFKAEEEPKIKAKEEPDTNDSQYNYESAEKIIMKNCPFCAEEIRFDAVKCKICGEWLNQQKIEPKVSTATSKSSDRINLNTELTKKERKSSGAKIALIVFLVVFVGIIFAVMNSNQKQNVMVKQQAEQTQAGIDKREAQARIEMQEAQAIIEMREAQSRIEMREAQSADLLQSCQNSCRLATSAEWSNRRKSSELFDRQRSIAYCFDTCTQDAMARNVEINKLREMLK